MNTREMAAEYRLAQWTQALEDRIANGENVKEFCQNRGVSRNTYFYWQRKLRETACKQLALKQAETTQRNLPAQSFTEIRVAQPAALPETTQRGLILMEIGGARLTIDSTYPMAVLAAFLLGYII